MAIQVTEVTREFRYAGMFLPDPDTSMAPEQVKAVFAMAYPELQTAVVEGPTESDGKQIFEFKRSAGTKG